MTDTQIELERLAKLAIADYNRAQAQQSNSIFMDLSWYRAANPAAILSLLADIRRMEQNAARYQWLHNHSQKSPMGQENAIHFSFSVSRASPNHWCVDTKRGEEMDAAIDNAMADK